MTIRVAVVDDHTLVRAGLVALLRDIPGVAVVAEGACGADAVRIAAAVHPDVLLLDLAMPGMSGIDALPQVCAADATIKVVVLSMHASEEHVLRALRDGASGYLLKDDAPTELERALQTVFQGGSWLSQALSGKVIGSYARRTSAGGQTLTGRQMEVLRLIADGSGTRDIANLLGLSVKTVETYRAQIMERLGIFDVPALVKYALREGLTTL